ncbi:hypothetical protein BDN72DRAFT_829744 [Pluteus cervinus]|uniref:Uncharacterized protein n=1 Tax=Pluteus cervinus TaxID=181527 RepID=A0ACD3BFT4_9AGAR|nr:hypothetical protein BDN72DRAFT_829744 [Pluteus cervinus]
MSLLQDVLRLQTADSPLERTTRKLDLKTRWPPSPANPDRDDSDDDLVNVVSLPGTPSRTRPSSPTRGAAARPLRGPLHLTSKRDPLRAFPTEVSQRIFARLSISDLAKCALVSKKWNRSQSLNYVWFQHYRKDNFHDESLPPGKWTRRESKQNWRVIHVRSLSERSPTNTSLSYTSGYATPTKSGYQTPRELKEEQWKVEADALTKPGKVEMRGMYKELGGRKAKSKNKLGSTGIRDKGGWDDLSESW